MAKRETPRQARSRRKAEWRQALAEGRVTRDTVFGTLRSFKTLAAMRDEIERAAVAGVDLEVLKVSYEEQDRVNAAGGER